MATSNIDSFIPSTKEYQVLQKYYGRLSRVITSPLTLAADLYSAELISEWTLTKATSENSSREMRTHHLLDELRGGVAIDSTNLMKIITVLQCHPPYLSAIAEEMKTECGKKQIYFNHSIIITIHLYHSTEQHHGGQSESTIEQTISVESSLITTTQPTDQPHVQSECT